MMRVVVDTNVLVSAIINPVGVPAQVLDQVFAGACEPLVSDAILAEYTRVLQHPRLRLPQHLVERMLQYFRRFSLPVPAAQPPYRCSDADDTKFLAAALAGDAAVLSTGNTRHFPKQVPGLRILTPAEFMAGGSSNCGMLDT